MSAHRLLLIDGTNAIMRRASVVPDVPPETVAQDVLGRLHRAARDLRASHAVIALDSNTSARAVRYPNYKFQRLRSTWPYTQAGQRVWQAAGWHLEQCDGWEADDIIATLATRTPREVVTLSSDNDLLMLASSRVRCAQYAPKGEQPWLRVLGPAEVQERYGIPVAQLLDFKSLVGDPSDAVTGAPGIGKKRAAKLLADYGTLADMHHALTPEQVAAADLSRWLIELKTDLPIPLIPPAECAVPLQPR